MKPLIRLTLATVLLAAAIGQCFAMMGIRSISPARAKELGIVVRAKPNGAQQVWVQLEFKAEGELKNFNRVSLEIEDGKKFLFGWSALQVKRSETGVTTDWFLVDREFLGKLTLRIVTGEPMNESGNDLRLKDFPEVMNPDSPANKSDTKSVK